MSQAFFEEQPTASSRGRSVCVFPFMSSIFDWAVKQRGSGTMAIESNSFWKKGVVRKDSKRVVGGVVDLCSPGEPVFICEREAGRKEGKGGDSVRRLDKRGGGETAVRIVLKNLRAAKTRQN